MSHASRLLGRTALACALAGSMAAAWAVEPITILFTGHGARGPTPGTWVGKADDWAGNASPIPGDWDVFRDENQFDLAARSFSGTFTWTDTVGNNNLYGRFVGGFELLGDDSHVRVFNNYVIEGGTGIFAGATSTFGEDRVYTNYVAGQYVESGLLKVVPVPEPSQMLLLAAGLAVIGTLWRRRT